MVRPARFEVTHERTDGRLAVSVAGQLDIGTVEMLREHIDEALDANLTELALDLGKLDFIDSTGLRFLIELNARSEGEPWRFSLRSPTNEAATLVFRITGMESALPFDGSSST